MPQNLSQAAIDYYGQPTSNSGWDPRGQFQQTMFQNPDGSIVHRNQNGDGDAENGYYYVYRPRADGKYEGDQAEVYDSRGNYVGPRTMMDDGLKEALAMFVIATAGIYALGSSLAATQAASTAAATGGEAAAAGAMGPMTAAETAAANATLAGELAPYAAGTAGTTAAAGGAMGPTTAAETAAANAGLTSQLAPYAAPAAAAATTAAAPAATSLLPGGVASLAGPAAALVGGAISANAAENAAEAQQAGADKALDLYREMFYKNIELQEPWRAVGVKGINALADRLGISGNTGAEGYGDLTREFDMQRDYLEDPGYQFRLSEGQKALERSAAARGGLLSGRAAKDTARFGQDQASQEFGNSWNRWNTQNTNTYNRLAGVSGAGQTAATNVGNAATQYGQNAANATMGAANAQAAGQVGQANAWTQGLGNAWSLYQQNQMMNSLLNR